MKAQAPRLARMLLALGDILLALSDEGAPAHDGQLAAKLAALGSPALAGTPELFPDLMAVAINRQDIGPWAVRQDIATSRESG